MFLPEHPASAHGVLPGSTCSKQHAPESTSILLVLGALMSDRIRVCLEMSSQYPWWVMQVSFAHLTYFWMLTVRSMPAC